MDRKLKLEVQYVARIGEKILATIVGSNLPETVVALTAPDTVVISPPHVQVAGRGSFKHQIEWTVEHVQVGTTTTVEITASAGPLTQVALCKVIG